MKIYGKYLFVTFLAGFILMLIPAVSDARPLTKWEQMRKEKTRLGREYTPVFTAHRNEWNKKIKQKRGEIRKEYREPILKAKHDRQRQNQLTAEMNEKLRRETAKLKEQRARAKAAIEAEKCQKKVLIEKKYGFYKPGSGDCG